MTSVGSLVPPRAAGAREVGAEMHDARLPGAVDARASSAMPRLLASTRRAAPSPRATASRPAAERGAVWSTSPPCTRHHERHVEPGAAHGVAGGHRVVGVDRARTRMAAQPAQGDAQRGRRPGPPGRVGALAGRGDVGDVGDRQAVALLVRARARSRAAARARRPRRSGAQRGARRHQAVQHEHVHLRARGAARRAPGGGPRRPARGRAGGGRTRLRRRPSPAAVGGEW